MRNFLALTRRELGVYFVSPMAYIILTALLFISGLAFMSSMQNFVLSQSPVDYQQTLVWVVFVVVLTSPLVTMRLIAEEKSKGTLEIILTAPVSEAAFILAKFASALVLLIYLLVPTVGYILIVSRYGPVDAGAVACGYFGVLLLGAALYSIGLFISSLCSSQITAGVLTFSVSVLFVLANIYMMGLEENSALRQILAYVDFSQNFADFLKGVIDRTRLVYLLSITGFFLFLTTRVVESRRWR
jgi:gliding motility-associated transport system permease protein